MIKKNLEQYRDLKNKQKEIDELIAELATRIVEEMRGESKDKLALADGTGVFTLAKRKNWTYSPTVTAMEASVKAQKAEEQAKGIAESTERDVLVFTVPEVK